MKHGLLLTMALTLSLLSGCGGSGSGVGKLSADGLTPVNGSDSIIGTWIGATDYIETQSNTGYTSKYQGSRLVVLQINSNGVGGYSLTDCDGNNQSVILTEQENVMRASVLGRDLLVSNFNEMSGTSTISEWGDQGEEDWSWVKVSNASESIGSVLIDFQPNDGAVLTETTDLLSLCRESLTYSDTDNDTWTTIADSGAFMTAQGVEKFIVHMDSDGWANLYLPALRVDAYSDEGSSVELNIKNASAANYKVDYASSGSTSVAGAYTFNATLTVQISD